MGQRVATKIWPFERIIVNQNCMLIYVVLHDDLKTVIIM